MSKVDPAPRPRSGIPLGGLALVILAVGCVLGYFRYPSAVKTWSGPFHAVFWSSTVLLFALGVQQLTGAWLPNQGRRGSVRLSRNRVQIPREGMTYLGIMVVLLMGALLGHSNMLLLVFAMMAGPFVVSGGTTFTMLRGSRLTRQAPARAMAGELFSVELLLRNQRTAISAWMMQASDVIEGADWNGVANVLFTRVPPQVTQTGHYDLRLPQRGRYSFGPLQLTSRFPLGLVERGLLFDAYDGVLIYPRVGRLAPSWRRRLVGANEFIMQSQTRAGVYQDEFHHLREFRNGDNPKSIHWRSSARRNVLISRQYHENREHRLAMVVELWQGSQPTELQQETVEQILRVAATLCVEYRRSCRQADLALALVGDHNWQWHGEAQASLEPVLDELATIQATPTADATPVLEELLQHYHAETRIVVLTTRTPDVGDPPWSQRIGSGRVQVIWGQLPLLEQLVIFDEPYDAAAPTASASAPSSLTPTSIATNLVTPAPATRSSKGASV